MSRQPHVAVSQLPDPLPAPDAEARAVITIDLGAMVRNWRRLRDLVAPAECAAVVKADAYGTGLEPAVEALAKAGCRSFFVASIDEGCAARAFAPDAVVYVLDGLFPDCGPIFADAGLRPVLGSVEELDEWAALSPRGRPKLPAAVLLDTGMNRLGIPPATLEQDAVKAALGRIEIALVMSHLACADEPGNPKNAAQRCVFNTARAKFSGTPASLSNSAGILLGPAYHFDLVRPGIALYGGKPNPDAAFETVVRVDGRVAQIRVAQAGETVGYGARQTLRRESRIAIVAAGYADGYFRALGASDDRPGAVVYVGDRACPLVGRVSMDLFAFDVTDLPADALKRGDMVELLGPHVGIDDLASVAGTLGYEVLTALGRWRADKTHIGG